jgi:hypothetical protein
VSPAGVEITRHKCDEPNRTGGEKAVRVFRVRSGHARMWMSTRGGRILKIVHLPLDSSQANRVGVT